MQAGSRNAWSCENCRRRKVKCNSDDPCKNCVRRGEECKWPGNAQLKRAENSIKERHECSDLHSRISRLEAAVVSLQSHCEKHDDAGSRRPSSSAEQPLISRYRDTPDASYATAASLADERHVEIDDLAAVRDDVIQLEVHRHDDFDHHIIDGYKSRQPNSLRARTVLSRSLPAKELCEELLQSYLLNVEWIHHTLHVPVFEKQYHAFWRDDSLDLQWTALLLTVLCLGSHFSRDPSMALEEKLYLSAQELLTLSDHLANHSVTTIQTLVLMGLWLNNRGQSSTHHAQLGLAVKMAMTLGLSKLDANSKSETVDQEIKRRLWWSLVCQDYYTSSSCNFTYTIQERQCKTELFSNADEHDLSTTPPLQDLATSSSYHLLKISFARVAKGMTDLYNEGLSYDAILELERVLWQAFNDLPDHWTSDIPMPASQHVHVKHLEWQRLFLGFTVHNRVLRLHRPFMARGYRDLSMVHSRQATIESALACISLAEQGREIGFPGLRWWVVLIHIFTSGVALCIDYHYLLQYKRCNPGSSLTELVWSRRRQISRAIRLLRKAADHNSVAARRAIAVLDGLVTQAEDDDRRLDKKRKRSNINAATHSEPISRSAHAEIQDPMSQQTRPVPQQASFHPSQAIFVANAEQPQLSSALSSIPESVSDIFMSPQESFPGDPPQVVDQDWLSSIQLEDWSGPDWEELLASMSDGLNPSGGISTDLYDTVTSFANGFMSA